MFQSGSFSQAQTENGHYVSVKVNKEMSVQQNLIHGHLGSIQPLSKDFSEIQTETLGF